MREAIEQAEATLLFLPPYSRDYNLIENAFSKLKALLRAKAERGPSRPCGTPWARSSANSPRRVRKTNSRLQDMNRIKQDAL